MDGFGGSLNLLYHWCLLFGPSHRYVAYELDPEVYKATSKNLLYLRKLLYAKHGAEFDIQYIFGDSIALIPQFPTK